MIDDLVETSKKVISTLEKEIEERRLTAERYLIEMKISDIIRNLYG